MKNDKKWWIGGLSLLIVLLFAGSQGQTNSSSQSASVNQEVRVFQTNFPVPIVDSSNTQTTQTSNLSNDNYYQNSAGNTVHSPAYTSDNAVPAGASAKCSDGTYSFSQSRRGTCSHHGGVTRWLQ